MKIISKPHSIKPDEDNKVVVMSVKVNITLTRAEFDNFLCEATKQEVSSKFVADMLVTACNSFNKYSDKKYLYKITDFS
jgi:hypothetical protein